MSEPVRFGALVALLLLGVCGVTYVMVVADDKHSHASITMERASQILRDSQDENLRDGARVAISRDVEGIIKLLLELADGGDGQARDMLARWDRLLHR